ncbi:MAG: site-specific DNA-methyltransferase [Alphaproteobacteria bacterium]|nr:site-specific DNA-methyltransferase [Alphaproteobacteria bacterium]
MDALKKEDGESLSIVDENIEALKAILPDAFAEDGIDFEVLRQLLGDEVAEGEEKYGLTWHGKKKARQIALTPSTGTLRPCPEESEGWATTQNLFIEGDNLEVLKLLQKSYAGKVKMIYIDPPYNTGGEFIYPDRYQENLDTYLKYTGQKDGEGFKTSSNTESSGRFHTNWLNMMLPRLKLAKNLLQQDGLIFVSIDDNEVENLKFLMNEIFGEENFVDSIVWKKRYGGGAKEKYLVTMHEYILVYCKDIEFLPDIFVPLSDEQIDRYYKSTDDNYEKRGPYRTHPLEAMKSFDVRENLKFPIPAPDGSEVWPKRQWRWGPERAKQALANGEIEFSQKQDGSWVLSSKQYLKDENGEIRKTKAFSVIDDVYSQHGTNEIYKLFGNAKIFDFPKPVGLMKQILDIGTDRETGDVVLDFFAGSAAMAHAVMEANTEDDGNRRFVMVQLPEHIEEKADAFKAGYKTIADIGMDRLRKAASAIKEQTPKSSSDLGFKVFKLDSSNIRAWNPDASDLEQTLLDHAEHLVEGRSEQDVLYELLLKRGVDLTVPIEEKEIAGKKVYSIGYGVLFACLDETIDKAEIEALGQGITDWHKELEPAAGTQVVFRDSAFADDIAKTNMTAILEQNGIAHVRSL